MAVFAITSIPCPRIYLPTKSTMLMVLWRNVFPSVRCLSISPLIHSFRGGTYHIQYPAPLDHHSKGSAALISISSRILCHFVTTAGVEPAQAYRGWYSKPSYISRRALSSLPLNHDSDVLLESLIIALKFGAIIGTCVE